MLQAIRGVEDVEEELGDIKAACRQAAKVENPWRTILKPAYRPQLVVALTATFFQQWTGINTCARLSAISPLSMDEASQAPAWRPYVALACSAVLISFL